MWPRHLEFDMTKTNLIGTLALCCVAFASSTLHAQASSAATDKQFLAMASQSDYTEIKFSQLAAEKASNARVKAYAQKMSTDHNMLEAAMKPFADKWGVAPNMTLDADHQAKYDALSAMSGTDFDKEYMKGMAADHHVALDAFKAEESATTDPEFKMTVSKGEKVVAEHTTMADKAAGMTSGAMPTSSM